MRDDDSYWLEGALIAAGPAAVALVAYYKHVLKPVRILDDFPDDETPRRDAINGVASTVDCFSAVSSKPMFSWRFVICFASHFKGCYL